MSESALLGQGGLDCTSPDREYKLRSLPGEEFSGLHLIALMNVGFQRVNASVDLQLPLADAYGPALGLYRARKQPALPALRGLRAHPRGSGAAVPGSCGAAAVRGCVPRRGSSSARRRLRAGAANRRQPAAYGSISMTCSSRWMSRSA